MIQMLDYLFVCPFLVACFKCTQAFASYKDLSFSLTLFCRWTGMFKKKTKQQPENKTPSMLWNRSGENLRAFGLHSSCSQVQ